MPKIKDLIFGETCFTIWCLEPVRIISDAKIGVKYPCYKVIQGFEVTCFIAGQIITKGQITTSDVFFFFFFF